MSDLVFFSGTPSNKYGHVAIVLKVSDDEVEIIQQNPGPFGDSRAVFSLTELETGWKIESDRLLGWLRK